VQNPNGRGPRSQAAPASSKQSMVSGRLGKPTSRVIRDLAFDQLEGEMRRRDWYNLVAACQDQNGKYTLFFSLKDEYRKQREDIAHEREIEEERQR